MLIKNTICQWISDCSKCQLILNISEAEIKLLNVSSLVKKLDFDAKISDIEGKYFTTSDYNKLTGGTLDSKIKQKELVNKFDIFNLLKDSD